ncbi:MAG: hypothetical protein WDN06_09280 [Asticcacaulis sp.]
MGALVEAFLRHIEDRYGADEVRSWYFEVWNEPNLSGFWEGGDQLPISRSMTKTAAVLKKVDPALRVGGPSTAGAGWVPEFLDHTKASGARSISSPPIPYGSLPEQFTDFAAVGDPAYDKANGGRIRPVSNLNGLFFLHLYRARRCLLHQGQRAERGRLVPLCPGQAHDDRHDRPARRHPCLRHAGHPDLHPAVQHRSVERRAGRNAGPQRDAG